MAMSISERPIRLTTDNAEAEVLLFDGRFQLVARGASPLETRQAPGVYSMRVKVGDEETEALLSVRPDDTPFTFELEAPRFDSPIPIERTSASPESHRKPVQRLMSAEGVTIRRGDGSAVMVCIRDPSGISMQIRSGSAGEEDRRAYAASFTGFRLLDSEGVQIVDLDAEAEHDLDEGYIAITVALTPGAYLLAYTHGIETICWSLPCVLDWTLQVFVNVAPAPAGKGHFDLQPDFADMAVMFGRKNSGFQPWQPDVLASETIRKGLSEGHNAVDPNSMRRLLSSKFENPMLGLYAGHLLLVEESLRRELLDEVLDNLARMLGRDFPDVVALEIARDKLALGTDPSLSDRNLQRLRAMRSRPVLLRSWDVLVRAAASLPPAALSKNEVFAIAGDLVQQGVFLCWRQRSDIVQRAIAISAPATEIRPSQLQAVREAAAPEQDLPVPSAVNESSADPSPSPSTPSGWSGFASAVFSRVWNVLSTSSLAIINSPAITAALRRIRGATSPTSPDEIRGLIEAITDEATAAVALSALVKRFDWKKIVSAVHGNAVWMASLSGLQRELILTLRDAESDPVAAQGIDGGFVKRLLESNRAPLAALVDSLSTLELAGWVSEGLAGQLQSTSATASPSRHGGA